jgi:hypothetical protein
MGNVKQIQYLNYDTHMISIGEKDSSILLWNIESEVKPLKN